MQQQMGKLYVVATPIGNLNDISLRAIACLKEVAWIAVEDTRHSQRLLMHYGITPPLISYHAHNEQERTPKLIQKMQQGESGALISDAGTPLISDPGYQIVAAAHAAGIVVVPIPGPCAFVAALSASGLPTDKFMFMGFLPAKDKARINRLLPLKMLPQTMVFYEAPHRILPLIEDCVGIFGADRPASIAREITKKFEATLLSTLGEMLLRLQNGAIPQKGEFVLIVSGAAPLSTPLSQEEQEIERLLAVLLAEVSLKQAVQIAVKLTGHPKNKLYEVATRLQKEA